MKLWRDHSKTVVGLCAGASICVTARLVWPDGGPDFDLVTIIGGVLLSFGIQGVIDMHFCEVAKPEDPVHCEGEDDDKPE